MFALNSLYVEIRGQFVGVDPGDCSQVSRLGGRHLTSLNHLACPPHGIFERKYMVGASHHFVFI